MIKIFLELAAESHLDPVKLKLILEVSKDWINDFSDGALRQFLVTLTKLMEDGSAHLSLISSTYVVCKAARKRFEMPMDSWIEQVNVISKNYLLNNINVFRSTCDERFVSYLIIYCETSTDLSQKPDQMLLDMFIEYLKDSVDGRISMSAQNDGPRKINLIVETLTRFALRDSDIAGNNFFLLKL